MPNLSGDYEVDVIEVCSALDEASAGEFVMEGFGRDRWPVDVAYDMSAFIEQLPSLLTSIQSMSDCELDLYSQGIESSFRFECVGSEVVILCDSRTGWIPNPEEERIDRDALISMLQLLAANVAQALIVIAPGVAHESPFGEWARGNV